MSVVLSYQFAKTAWDNIRKSIAVSFSWRIEEIYTFGFSHIRPAEDLTRSLSFPKEQILYYFCVESDSSTVYGEFRTIY